MKYRDAYLPHNHGGVYHVSETELRGGEAYNLAEDVEPADDPSYDSALFARDELCRCGVPVDATLAIASTCLTG